MTTGILGGAFDPPHAGHVALAREAISRFGLERLLVLVVAEPGHKPVGTAADERLELARAAFAEIALADVQLEEQAYTVDSLRVGGVRPGLHGLPDRCRRVHGLPEVEGARRDP